MLKNIIVLLFIIWLFSSCTNQKEELHNSKWQIKKVVTTNTWKVLKKWIWTIWNSGSLNVKWGFTN